MLGDSIRFEEIGDGILTFDSSLSFASFSAELFLFFVSKFCWLEVLHFNSSWFSVTDVEFSVNSLGLAVSTGCVIDGEVCIGVGVDICVGVGEAGGDA